MAGSRVEMFQSAKTVIRSHPDWTDEQVAEHAGIPRAMLDLVATARRDLGADTHQLNPGFTSTDPERNQRRR